MNEAEGTSLAGSVVGGIGSILGIVVGYNHGKIATVAGSIIGGVVFSLIGKAVAEEVLRLPSATTEPPSAGTGFIPRFP